MKKNQRWYRLLILVPLIYIFLVGILYLAEAGQPDSQIRSVGDAVWYSLVTLTTVGYGDIMPVTFFGRAISIFFLLLSTGLMVTLFGAAFSFLTGEAFPLFRLRRLRRRNWYYFVDCGPESVTMARNMLEEDPHGVIIFGEKPGEQGETAEFPCFYLQTPLTTIISCKENEGTPCTVFFMRENDYSTNPRGLDIQNLPVTAYAHSSNNPNQISSKVNFFYGCECCARQYWQTLPLKPEEKQIVLIGFGEYGQNLLERAILTNIISPKQQITYHIFGDGSSFLNMHYRLRDVFQITVPDGSPRNPYLHHEHVAAGSLPGPSAHHEQTLTEASQPNASTEALQPNASAEAPQPHASAEAPQPHASAEAPQNADRLWFHAEPWEAAHDILENADRIIICMDQEMDGWSAYWNIYRYYHVNGRIDVRCSREIPDVSCFGTDRDIYSPHQILRHRLNVSAIAMNDIYRASTSRPTLTWEELSGFMQQSKIAAADHLLMKVRILLPEEDIIVVDKDILNRAYAAYSRAVWDPEMEDRFRRIEHIRWRRFYAFHNWSYGPDDQRSSRHHPMMRPYDQLNDREKAHHDYSWQLLKELTNYI